MDRRSPATRRPMVGTSIPKPQLYMLIEWLDQEERENERGFFKQMRKKGVFHSHQEARSRVQTPLDKKWSEAFIEARKDGIPELGSRTTSGGPRARSYASHAYHNGTDTNGRPYGHPETIASSMLMNRSKKRCSTRPSARP